ncbi:hypothetical protein FALCPG4_006915 [Fusarium falciforme]
MGLGLFGSPSIHHIEDAGVVDHITWLKMAFSGILPSMGALQFISRDLICIQVEKLGKSVASVASPLSAFCFLLPCLVLSPAQARETTHAPRASLLPPFTSQVTHKPQGQGSEASWACQFRALIGRPEELTLCVHIFQALAGRRRRGGSLPQHDLA